MGQQQSTSDEFSDDLWTRESVSSDSLGPKTTRSLPAANHVRTSTRYSSSSDRETLAVFDETVRSPTTRGSPTTHAEHTRHQSVEENGAPARARARLSSSDKPIPAHAPELRSLPLHQASLEDRQHALRRGRRVIRRGRTDDSDSPGRSVTRISRGDSRRRVSFRARMHYDLVLDRTATIRRRDGSANRNGKLTLITTRKALQRADGNLPVLSECAESVEEIVVEDVMVRVRAYNQESGRELMWVTYDGTALEGYIDVELKLDNPITVLHRGDPSRQRGPREAALRVMYFANYHRTLLISSDTTVSELIETLIAAYHVVDQPSYFALHECRKGKQFVGRALDGEERPLLLSLLWGANSNKCLELREVRPSRVPNTGAAQVSSDSGIASSAASTLASVRSATLPSQPKPTEKSTNKSKQSSSTINWSEFTLPELDNFLRMLKNEEEKQVEVIEKRYEKKRHSILEQMHDLARQGMADSDTPYGTLV